MFISFSQLFRPLITRIHDSSHCVWGGLGYLCRSSVGLCSFFFFLSSVVGFRPYYQIPISYLEASEGVPVCIMRSVYARPPFTPLGSVCGLYYSYHQAGRASVHSTCTSHAACAPATPTAQPGAEADRQPPRLHVRSLNRGETELDLSRPWD